MYDGKSCFDPRAAAVAMMRWGLGSLFLIAGMRKVGDVSGFVHGVLLPSFSKTVLPPALTAAFGYGLPYVECALGVCLLVGLCRNAALVVAGLTLLSLGFGQMLLGKADVLSSIFLYLSATSAVLFLDEFDTWRACRCSRR